MTAQSALGILASGALCLFYAGQNSIRINRSLQSYAGSVQLVLLEL
jgi:hypothetical protein